MMLVEGKASCCVADAFLTRLKLIWLPLISSLKISKMSRKCIFGENSSRSWWVNKSKYIVQNCKWKQIKMKETFGRFENGEMCFSSLGSRHRHKLAMILRQHYHYIGHLFAFFPVALQCLVFIHNKEKLSLVWLQLELKNTKQWLGVLRMEGQGSAGSSNLSEEFFLPSTTPKAWGSVHFQEGFEHRSWI